MKRRTALMMPALIPPFVACRARAAGSFPDQPIRLIVPFAAGGSNDLVGRVVAEGMAAALGQTIVVENRGGAGGVLGNDLVAKSRPDGYNLLLAGSGSFLISGLVQPRLPYDLEGDFSAIGFIGDSPMVIAANPGSGIRSMPDLQTLARRAQPPVAYATAGIGTTGHATGALIEQALGIQMEHVPYRGTGPALTDVLAGRVALISNPLAPLRPHLESGGLIGLAVAATRRSATMPQIPTTAEQGFPQIVSSAWYGLVAPGGLPADRAAILHAALAKALAQPGLRRRLEEEGTEIQTSASPEEFGTFLRQDRKRWQEVVQKAGMRVE